MATVVVGLVIWANTDRTFNADWHVSIEAEPGRRDQGPVLFDPASTSFPISVNTEGCFNEDDDARVDRVEVEESDAEVVVTAYISRVRTDSNDDCLEYRTAQVELDRPLGDRELLSGHTDPPSPPPPG